MFTGPLVLWFYFASVRSFSSENLERKTILEKVFSLAHIFNLVKIIFKRIFLAHLSRRLIGELLVHVYIEVSVVRRQHFQTTASLKPLG